MESKYEQKKGTKNTLVVNLIGGPGTGKTTTMALVFGKLKTMGIDAEMVTEFPKELVWEHRTETMKDELYIFAKQAHRFFRVNGQVDVIVTDRPIILTVLYNNLYGDKSSALDAIVKETFEKYNNLNFFLNRVKEYNPNGRTQTEEESNEIADGLYEIMKDYGYDFIEYAADEEVADKIISDILNILK